MTNPPEIPKDIIESYKKLSEAKQKRLEFMAAYPEYLLDKNREDLLNGIDLIRKDFQENTRQIAEELSKSSSRTAWKIAIFSLFGGFLLGLVSALVVPWVFRITNIETDVSASTTKTVSPEHLSTEKAQTPKSE
ncbi:MAG: hypothetical protein ACLRRK_04410 [Parasutterella sp.]|jgi:hypothetical protein|nr:MAG TPA: G-rich domain on putative tyrosine kinase [Caudoviricetes sp.]